MKGTKYKIIIVIEKYLTYYYTKSIKYLVVHSSSGQFLSRDTMYVLAASCRSIASISNILYKLPNIFKIYQMYYYRKLANILLYKMNQIYYSKCAKCVTIQKVSKVLL